MDGLNLTEPPATLPDDKGPIWRGESTAPPTVGDLWLLSWDGSAVGLVVLSRVRDSYVVGWPASLPDEPSFAPALVVMDTALGVPVTVWPQAATGLGLHLLHRRVATLLPPATLRATDEAARTGGDCPLPRAPERGDNPTDDAFISELLMHYQALCYHEWPSSVAGEGTLTHQFLDGHDVEARELVEALRVSVPVAVELLDGSRPPTAVQVDALSSRWRVPPDDFLEPASDEATRLMLRSRWKDDIGRVVSRRGVTEAQARALIRQEFALAARTDPWTKSDEAKMKAAIGRLLGETGGPADR